jgi:hypothetical protein
MPTHMTQVNQRDLELKFIDAMCSNTRFSGTMYTTARIMDRSIITQNRY